MNPRGPGTSKPWSPDSVSYSFENLKGQDWLGTPYKTSEMESTKGFVSPLVIILIRHILDSMWD